MTTMKPVFAALLLAASVAAHAQQVPPVPATATTVVQDKTQPSPRLNPAATRPTQPTPAAPDRAARLTNQMAHDLHLNGYQTSQVRAINADKTAKLEALERQYASDPKTLAEKSRAVDQERATELQSVLTTDQYTDYFDARKRYAQTDQNYARNASAANLINSIQNPTPTRANNATIGPAQTTGKPNRAAVRQ